MNKAILMFSGGQDSATCLFWALENFDLVETVGFDYNQRHNIELEVRTEFIQFLKEEFPKHFNKIGKDHRINAKNLSEIGIFVKNVRQYNGFAHSYCKMCNSTMVLHPFIKNNWF